MKSASNPTSSSEIITAAVLVIGDEILSGRTKDRNIGYIADHLTAIGIQLREVRVVPDIEDDIVAAVNALRARYTYLFTTGGIGPTHDDITSDCIAKAFGAKIDIDPRALALMKPHYERRGIELTPARLRMARLPEGSVLVENSVSVAPGFMMDNVVVMAGIPNVMQVMLDAVTPKLKTGRRMLSTMPITSSPNASKMTPLTTAPVARKYNTTGPHTRAAPTAGTSDNTAISAPHNSGG